MEDSYEIFIYEAAGKEPFTEWLQALDNSVQGYVLARLERLEKGNFGNAKSVGSGLYELKFKNPAFRIYYSLIGRHVVLLISAGGKSKQSADIKKAKSYLEEYRSRGGYGRKKD